MTVSLPTIVNIKDDGDSAIIFVPKCQKCNAYMTEKGYMYRPARQVYMDETPQLYFTTIAFRCPEHKEQAIKLNQKQLDIVNKYNKKKQYYTTDSEVKKRLITN